MIALLQILAVTALCGALALVARLLNEPLVLAAAAGLPLAALAGLAMVRAPFVACVAFVCLSVFRLHEAFPFLAPLRLPNVLAALSLGSLLLHVLHLRTIRPWWSREMTLFSAFLAMVTVGVAFASDREIAWNYWSGGFSKTAIMLYAIAWMAREPEDFGRTCRWIVLSGTAISLVALYNKVNGIGLVEGTRVTIGRDIRSNLGDPNDLALALLFPLAFACGLALTRGVPFLQRSLGALSVPLTMAAIVATQSRGGLLGAVAVLGVVGARKIRSRAVLVALGAVGLFGLFAVAGISGRQSGGAGEIGIDESSMGRLHAWAAAFRMALHNPVFGVGLNNYVVNYFDFSDFWDGKNHAVHSTWFAVLAEAGFPGLGLMAAIIVLATLRVRRAAALLDRKGAPAASRAIALALLAGVAGFCVSGSFLTQAFSWPIWVMVALALALSRYSERFADPPPPPPPPMADVVAAAREARARRFAGERERRASAPEGSTAA